MTRDDALAAEFVIGTLDAAERAEVRTRMAVDISFAARVRAWERALAPLYELVTPIAPPPALWLSIEEDLSDSRSGMFGSRRGRGRKGQELPPAEPADAAAGEADARRRKPGETAKGGVGKALSAPFHAVKGLVRGLRSRPPEVGEAPRDDAREPKAPLEIAPPDVAPPEPPKRSSRHGRGSAGKAAAPIPHIRDDMTVPEAVAPDVRAERAQEPRHSSPDTAPEAPPVMSPVAEKGGEAQSGTAALALVPAVVLPEFKVTQLVEDDGNEAVPTPAGMAPHVPDEPASGSVEAPATDADGASPIDEGTSVGPPVRSRPAPAGAEADAASGGRADEAARADTAPAFDTIEPAPRGDVEAAGAPLQLPETLADAEPVPAMETGEASASEPLVDWEDRIEAGPARPLSMDVEAHPSGPAEDAAAHPSAPGAGELPAAQAGASQADIEPELPDSSAAASAAGLAALTEELQALLFADDETDADIPLIREAAEPLPLGEPAEAPPAPASGPEDAMSRLHAEEPQAPPEALAAAATVEPTARPATVAAAGADDGSAREPVPEHAPTSAPEDAMSRLHAEEPQAPPEALAAAATDEPTARPATVAAAGADDGSAREPVLEPAPTSAPGDAMSRLDAEAPQAIPAAAIAAREHQPTPAETEVAPVSEPAAAATSAEQGEAAAHAVGAEAGEAPAGETGDAAPVLAAGDAPVLSAAEVDGLPEPAQTAAVPVGEPKDAAARTPDGEAADLSAVEAASPEPSSEPGETKPAPSMPEFSALLEAETELAADGARGPKPAAAEASPSGESANQAARSGDGEGADLSAAEAVNPDRRPETVEATEAPGSEEPQVVMPVEPAVISDAERGAEPLEAEAAPSGAPAIEAAHFGDDQAADLSALDAANEDLPRQTVEAAEAPGSEEPQVVMQAEAAAIADAERGPEPVEAEAAPSGEPANQAARSGDGEGTDLSAAEAVNPDRRPETVEATEAPGSEEPQVVMQAEAAAIADAKREAEPVEAEAAPSGERANAGSPAGDGDGADLSAVETPNEDRRREIVEATEELEPEEFRVVMRAEKAAIADGDHRPEPVEAEAAPSGKPANEAAHFGDDQTAALSAVEMPNEDRGRETVEATEAPGPEAPQMVFQADMAATPAGERGSEPVEAQAVASGEPANEAVRFGDAQAADLSAVEAANQEPRGDAVEVPIALSIEEPPAPTDAGPAAVSGRAPEPSPSETEASHSGERADPARSGDIEAAAVPTAAATDQEVSGEPQDTAPVASAEAPERLPEGGAVPVAELGSSASDTAGDGDAVQTEAGAEPPGAGEVAADGEGPPRWVPAWPKLRERAENVGPKSRVPAMVPGRAPPAADAVSGRDGLAAPLDARPIVKAVVKRRPTAVALSAKRALEPEVKSLGIKAKAPPAPSPEGPTPTAEPVAETAARTKGAEIPELGASQPQDEVAVERPDAAPARGAGARSKPGESGKPPSDRPEDAGVAGSEAGEAAVPTSDEAERPLPPLRTVEPSPRGSRRARVLWAVGALAVALGLGIGSDMLAHWRGDGAPQPRRVELAPVFVANPPTEVRLRLDERSGRTELRIIAAEPAPPGYIYQLRLKTEGGGTHLLGTFASEMVTVSDLGRLLAGSAPGTARLSVTLDSLDAPGTPGEEVYNARIGG
ncbi:hypothetical protein [Xanthobacter variabilis]|uniref:hypothetical protein n=1 Tax=Xanthobacter variabilis TaxID=3119932 RepID=UPI00374E64CE